MPAFRRAIAVTVPAMPPPMIRAVVMVLRDVAWGVVSWDCDSTIWRTGAPEVKSGSSTDSR
ncbi:hypothetical protein TPA0910_76580 [Streptomyces hygroscopicus subsp. sporocinereus]|uniref:Uncharacterized protein n=1 Tax=Streptomyces hygroscopicus TaxID=1912 RepID=A0ABQ3UC96_STRHY|nr:hypothetical protein TPA0910_76580 [Streptomyces hygroscopicus]